MNFPEGLLGKSGKSGKRPLKIRWERGEVTRLPHFPTYIGVWGNREDRNCGCLAAMEVLPCNVNLC